MSLDPLIIKTHLFPTEMEALCLYVLPPSKEAIRPNQAQDVMNRTGHVFNLAQTTSSFVAECLAGPTTL